MANQLLWFYAALTTSWTHHYTKVIICSIISLIKRE